MSHAVEWRCRSCRAVLGHVRDGVLRPLVPVESVDGWGVAGYRVRAAGESKLGFPARITSAA